MAVFVGPGLAAASEFQNPWFPITPQSPLNFSIRHGPHLSFECPSLLLALGHFCLFITQGQVKSRATLRGTYSRRQAGAMRPVRRAGWVWVWAASGSPAAKFRAVLQQKKNRGQGSGVTVFLEGRNSRRLIPLRALFLVAFWVVSSLSRATFETQDCC